MKILVVAILTLTLGAPLAAQWLTHATPGIPRTPDGKPNLAAPPPRTPDGKPDLSGLWTKFSPKYARNIAADLKPGRDPAMGTRSRRRASGGSRQGRHAGALSAARTGVSHGRRLHRLRDGAHRPDAATHPDAQPRPHISPSLDGRPRAGAGAESVVDGVLGRTLGRRHARGRELRIPSGHLARSRRQHAHREAAPDRAVSSAEFRQPRGRGDVLPIRKPTRGRLP